MKKIYWFYSTLLFLIFFIVISSYGILFPSDVLLNIPSFSEDGWQRPKNALQADPVYQFEPWRDFSKSEILAGRMPLWNDLNGNGAPLFANSINAAFYPLTIIYYLLPVGLSLTLIHMLKLILFFAFCYLYIRSLKVNTVIAVFGALAATFSGYMIMWLYWPQTNVYLLLPLLLYVAEKIYRKKKQRYAWYAATAIIYFLMILGNHPETLFHIGMLHSAYILFRFWNDFRTIAAIFCSIFIGFLLGAVQILPLLEYLKYSYVLESRSLIPHNFSLPFISILLMVIPFMFGSPHLPYYRHITQSTNFQEVLGGYTGIIVIIVAIIGIFRYSKDTLIRFWSIVILVSFAMSYNIWPIKYINALPFMSTSANHRLIAFVNFGLLIIFCLVLQKYITEYKVDKAKAALANKIFILLSLIAIVLTIVGGIYLPHHLPKYADFIPFFLWHTLFILLATIFFFWSFAWYVQKRISSRIFLITCLILVAAQTVGFFWNYNPLVDQKYYYPKTDVVRLLERAPRGNIIELGNPSLPPNANMMYKIPHVINNDAVEIKWYRHKVRDTLQDKNHWGNPESITQSQLQQLNVAYILSDFDITLTKNRIQPDGAEILHPITRSAPYIVNFKPTFDNFSELRIKTANYNRQNTCHISITLYIKSTHKEIMQQHVPCADIRNNMFYTLPMSPVGLEKNTEYQFEIRSDTDDEKNAVAFFGSHNKPYLELLSRPEKVRTDVAQLGKTKSTYVWEVNGIQRIGGIDSNKILYEDPQKIVLDVTTDKKLDLTLKKTYYPGWVAKVNGKEVRIANDNPYMSIPLNKGKSYIEVAYKPLSFTLGLGITVLAGLGILLYVLRGAKDTLSQKYEILALHEKVKKKPFWQHVIIVALGIVLSSLFFVLLVLRFPIFIENPWTTAINWFTRHNYPRYQDYFYFYGGFAFVTLGTFITWLIWLWRKK